MAPFVRSLLLALVAAASGGVVAYGVADGSGSGGTTTIVRTVEAAATVSSTVPGSTALSAREIYKRDAPGVVVITATTVSTQQDPLDPFGTPQQQQSESLGSGFVVDRDGHILTNAHVVLNARKVEVGFSNGATYRARIVGTDRATDVAVLQVDVPSHALRPLATGSASDVEVGDPVVAIGNPLGTERTITSGIISAVSREIDSLVPGVKIYGALQTDAAINHGNSGGPLIDAAGKVVGINSQILSENNGNVGIGFAIPMETARRVAREIIATGRATHTWLGIEGSELTPGLASSLDLPVDHGVVVARVAPGSPAGRAGLRGGNDQATIDGQSITLGGDVITRIGGADVRTFADLARMVAEHAAGDRVDVTFVRAGKTRTVTVTLASRSQ
jgi:S1-C subfamily serine protease